MNYIAHIHLGDLTHTSKLGNFLGDFVKGDLMEWSHEGMNENINNYLKDGIILHRKIDVFTDSHPTVKQLKHLFPPKLRRVSGIVLDIYFDHLLCKELLSTQPLSTHEMLQGFYNELSCTNLFISSRFQQVKKGLLSSTWLTNYQYETGYTNAFKHIEKRFNGKINFADHATDFLKSNSSHILKGFEEFYPHLMLHARELTDSSGITQLSSRT